MNEQHAGAGWYADPAGLNELRYFDGRWTDRAATLAVVLTVHPGHHGSSFCSDYAALGGIS